MLQETPPPTQHPTQSNSQSLKVIGSFFPCNSAYVEAQ